MKFIAIFLLMSFSSFLSAGIKNWALDVDQSYVNRNVKNTHIDDELKYLLEEFPLDVTSVSLKELRDSLDEAVSRARVKKEKESDRFLGFIYCMKVGINSDDLLRESQSNELLLTYLIAGLINKDNLEFYNSIKRVDRRKELEK